MKFIHAADLHLDSPLCGLERYEGAPVADLRGATRRALENLVRLGIDEKVDFVLIAGDVYDGDWRDYNTGLFFSAQMSKLREVGIPIFLIRGNHDAASQITRELRLPDNVTSFSTQRPATVRLERLGVAIHGQGFHTQAVWEDLSDDYPLPVMGFFNVGLLHTSVDGREGHVRYAPCGVSGLKSKGYDYWALGHVHKREVLSREPWIVFPGNPQGRHARETGDKGCALVTVTEGRIDSVEHRALQVVRWCQCEVNVDGVVDGEDILDRARRVLEEEIGRAGEGLLAIRLRVVGACRTHAELGDPERCSNEIRAMAIDIGGGRVWIEKLQIQTRAEVELGLEASHDGPIGDLLRSLRQLPEDETTLNSLLAKFKDLKQKLPIEIRQGEDAIDLDNPQLIREMLPEVEQELLARLGRRYLPDK